MSTIVSYDVETQYPIALGRLLTGQYDHVNICLFVVFFFHGKSDDVGK